MKKSPLSILTYLNLKSEELRKLEKKLEGFEKVENPTVLHLEAVRRLKLDALRLRSDIRNLKVQLGYRVS